MYAFNSAAIFYPGHPYIESTTVLSDTCTVLHGPEATMRYYGAEPAPTVASHAQRLKFLLSSAFAEETVLLVGSKSKLLLKGVLGCTR